jgi:flagellar basal body-associated protein FliL
VAEHPQLETKAFAISDKVLTLFIALNCLAMGGVTGLFYYTKIIYQKPRITEKTERERLDRDNTLKKKELNPTFVSFESITVNLRHSYNPSQKIKNENESTPEQKPHFITLSMAIEVRDEKQKDLVESFKAFFLDELIRLLGRRSFEELITVQGRYVLNSQITEKFNQIINSKLNPTPAELLITHTYFTQFIVQ